MRTDYLSWDYAFFGIAFMAAMRSKDPSTQCGACVMRKNRPLGWGYNGLVSGFEDSDEIWDREEKLKWIFHAERNAIANCVKAGVSSFDDSEIFIWTSSPSRVHLPCADCSRTIVQYGIPVVNIIASPEVIEKNDFIDERWGTDVSMKVLDKNGVKLNIHSSKDVNNAIMRVAINKLVTHIDA